MDNTVRRTLSEVLSFVERAEDDSLSHAKRELRVRLPLGSNVHSLTVKR